MRQRLARDLHKTCTAEIETIPVWRVIWGRKLFGSLPGEQDTPARIKALHRNPRGRKRRSCSKIAAILNDEGRPTRTGRPWNPGTVWALLKR